MAVADAKSSLELCVNDIKIWMQYNFLKLIEPGPILGPEVPGRGFI